MDKQFLDKDKKIIVVDNFFTDDEFEYCKYVIKLSKWNKDHEWIPKFNNRYTVIYQDILIDAKERVNSIFDGEFNFSPFIEMFKLNVGDIFEEHIDTPVNPQGNKDARAAIVYLNDDFEGGELYYPNLGITHKPKANQLVSHVTNDINYLHGVTPVSKNNRYFFNIYGWKNE